MLLRGLRCHSCNSRSKHSKGTTEFECTQCGAFNYFDSQGNILEPPEDVVNQPTPQRRGRKQFQTFTRPADLQLQHQQSSAFCDRCQKNQQIVVEALCNYPPKDVKEGTRRYEVYMDSIPEYKADLDKRYPQVCKKCAPKVQEQIHKADYYGMSQRAAAAMKETRARGGHSPVGARDDWSKRAMRLTLCLLGMVIYASLLAQIAWHAYGILITMFSSSFTDQFETTDFAFDPTSKECAAQVQTLRFDTSCYQLLGTLIPKALVASFCLLWYNHGIKDWYHHTYRIEAIHGQAEHFRIQLVLLVARTIAWHNLSNPSFTSELTGQQLLAAHGFTISLSLVGQYMSERPIKSDRWKIKGKIMPRPDDVDILGVDAGPAQVEYTRQASSIPPFQLFKRDERPFPIENLAPKPRRGYSNLESAGRAPPSPPESVSDDEDAMEIDYQPPSRTAGMPGAPVDRTYRPKYYGSKKSEARSIYNYGTTQPLGWASMREELFGIQDQTQAEDERRRKEEEERAKRRYQPPVEQSPFRGRLPPAPRSQEAKLRNPISQVQFKQQPLSEQKDFMKRMRDSFEHGKAFKTTATPRSKEIERLTEVDDDFSPIKSRTGWTLQDNGASATGLEDLFAGRGFGIADEPSIVVAPAQDNVSWIWVSIGGLLVGVVLTVVASSFLSGRRMGDQLLL